jgi:hypothetical protein
MPLVEFEPAVPAGEQLQTHAPNCVGTRIGDLLTYPSKIPSLYLFRFQLAV